MTEKTTKQRPAIPMLAGLTRPNWLTSKTKQEVMLLRDGSGSMRGQKAREVDTASQDLVNELAKPENKNGFMVAVIDYNENSQVVHPFTQAGDLDRTMTSISANGATNIAAALEEANSLLSSDSHRQEEGVEFVRSFAIVLSDGLHNKGPHPSTAANELKKHATVVTVAFGNDADEDLLKKLATTEQEFYRCRDGRELRAFLATVGPTLAESLPTGDDPARLLRERHSQAN